MKVTYSGDLLRIDGQKVPKIINYDVEYDKLWGSDSGRSLAGDMKATLVGIFPKICLKIGATTEDDMSWFLSKANKAFITVEWYDAEIKGTRTAQCYSNNLKASLKSKKRMAYSSFEWNLIPLKKR